MSLRGERLPSRGLSAFSLRTGVVPLSSAVGGSLPLPTLGSSVLLDPGLCHLFARSSVLLLGFDRLASYLVTKSTRSLYEEGSWSCCFTCCVSSSRRPYSSW